MIAPETVENLLYGPVKMIFRETTNPYDGVDLDEEIGDFLKTLPYSNQNLAGYFRRVSSYFKGILDIVHPDEFDREMNDLIYFFSNSPSGHVDDFLTELFKD